MLDEVVSVLRREGGQWVWSAISGTERLEPGDLAHPGDHGLFGPGSVAWRVHGQSSMLIGGLRALLLQTLHPLAMAGVADRSDYRHDPWGRLHRTGRFIGAATYGTTDTAEESIEMVRSIHRRVAGTAPDGRSYRADDPHLLLWVHVTEVDSFLAAFDRYGTGRLTDAERDRYVAETAEIGHRLGAEDPPTDRAGLDDRLQAFRPELRYGDQARQAVRFLLVPPVPLLARGPYRLISAAAVGLLPPWARRMLLLPLPPGLDPLAIRPGATVLTRAIGWLMDDLAEQERDDRLLSP
jgi:uncharacterized protein (DUF2236 family)